MLIIPQMRPKWYGFRHYLWIILSLSGQLGSDINQYILKNFPLFSCAVAKPVKGKSGTNPFVKQLNTIVNVLALLGVGVLLLTAFAQSL